MTSGFCIAASSSGSCKELSIRETKMETKIRMAMKHLNEDDAARKVVSTLSTATVHYD